MLSTYSICSLDLELSGCDRRRERKRKGGVEFERKNGRERGREKKDEKKKGI